MNCLVVDDDEVTRKLLGKYIAKIKFLNLVRILSSPVEVVNYLSSIDSVDLLFVDIEMP